MIIEQPILNKKTIFLEGMSLRGSFTVTNPNKMLAISFCVENFQKQLQLGLANNDQAGGIGSSLSIFPKSGILLQNQLQKITVIYKPTASSVLSLSPPESFLSSTAKILIKYTVSNNFNKLLIRNNKLPQLNNQAQLDKYSGVVMINVEIGTDYVRIKEEIQTQVMLESCFGQDGRDISGIFGSGSCSGNGSGSLNRVGNRASGKVNVEVLDGLGLDDGEDKDVAELVNSLQLSSKIKQSNASNKTSDPSQLSSPIHLQKNQLSKPSSIVPYPKTSQIKQQQEQDQISQQNTETTQHNSPNSFQSFHMHTVRNDTFSRVNTKQEGKKSRTYIADGSSLGNTETMEIDRKKSHVSSFEVLVFAVLAAFFYSLGANFAAFVFG